MAEVPAAREMPALPLMREASASRAGRPVTNVASFGRRLPGVAAGLRRRTAPVGVPGSASGGVRWLLRLEGGAVLALALVAYAQTGAGWLALAVLFFAPDLSLLGYLAGPRAGALLYNGAHSLLGPLATIAIGTLGGQPVALAAGLVWLAHVGFDRLCGFGLHYTGGPGRTHLGPIGRPDPW